MTAAQWRLESLAAEIEDHVATAGWDQVPRLFAFVATRDILDSDPSAAASLGLSAADDVAPDALTPVEQDELPEGDIEQLLAQIGWPDSIHGCALSQEIVFLPPEAEADLAEDALPAVVAQHPQRREARLVVAALRDGTAASLLRLRPVAGSAPGDEDDLLSGDQLAPNLVQALLATFEE